jgi:hypothetical protein
MVGEHFSATLNLARARLPPKTLEKEIFTFFERNAFFLRTLYVGTSVSKTDLTRAGDAASVVAAAQGARTMPGPDLMALALRVAQRTSRQVHPVFIFHAVRMLHPWRLLSLWVYASARGITDAREVVQLTLRDASARELLRGDLASEETLRRFYTYNEDTIATCVGDLLRALREQKRGKDFQGGTGS